MNPFGFGNSQPGGKLRLELRLCRTESFHRGAPSAKVRAFLTFFVQRPGMTEHNTNPLHGVTLEQILNALVQHYEWSGLAERIDIRCFKSDPSIKSSLTFLRKTPWAREKVEKLYVKLMRTKRPL
ncbi:hypothetical protein D3C71_1319630 [compost metagenome]